MGRLPAGGRTAFHLKNCTGCLTCQTVCPAGVPYDELIDLGRAELRRRGNREGLWDRLPKTLARLPRLSRALLALLRWCRHLGARRLGGLLGIRADSFPGRVLWRLPAKSPNRTSRHRRQSTVAHSRVMLFKGCVSSSLDLQTQTDAIDVLFRCGYQVEMPAGQDCCGALDLHDGNAGEASQLAAKNLAAFGTTDTPILALASGCAATLDEYGRLAAGRGGDFRRRLHDLGSFLHACWGEGWPDLGPLTGRAALFQPCTARNNRRRDDLNAGLLSRIPGLDVRILGAGFGCCGAAGDHFLTRAAQADALVAPILDEILALDPEYVAVSNVGCALHLSGALEAAGHRAMVLHPVSLLRRSLEATD